MANEAIFTPGADPESEALRRKYAMAQELQKGLSNAQGGQMVGNRFVANPWQTFADVYRSSQGKEREAEALQGYQELGAKKAAQTADALRRFGELSKGTTAFEAAGPAPQVQEQGGGYNVPGQKPDLMAAYSSLMNTQDPTLRQAGMKGIIEAPQMQQEAMLKREKMLQDAQLARERLQDRQDARMMMASMRPERNAQIIQTDQGPMQLVGGKAMPIIGVNGQPVKGAAGDKALTEAQANATMYGMRMHEADKILRDLEKGGNTDTGLISTGVSGTLGAIPLVGEALSKGAENTFNALPSVLGGLSEPQQQTKQARANFITAVLRKESGASISPSEFAKEEIKYFPQTGDTPKPIAQKQAARKLAIEAMQIGAGPGASKIGGGAQNAPTSSGW